MSLATGPKIYVSGPLNLVKREILAVCCLKFVGDSKGNFKTTRAGIVGGHYIHCGK